MPPESGCAISLRPVAAPRSMADMVKRKTTTLMAINASVTTGQRRASMFSCLMGINIALRPCHGQNHDLLATV